MLRKINLRPNVPVDLALAYTEGRQVNGSGMMFTTTDQRVLFVPIAAGVEISRQLKEVGVRAGETILVSQERTRNGKDVAVDWKVYRAPQRLGEQPDGSFVVPAPPGAQQHTEPAGHATELRPTGPQFTRQISLDPTTATLIDTYARALDYAREKYGDRISPADVLALVIAARQEASRA